MSEGVYERLFAAPATGALFHGVVIGVVTNTKDPDGLGRVKVKLPWLADEAETGWARMAVPMAGNGRGVFFPPEVDDEVLLAFEHGSPQSPFVIGALWNGKDKPPDPNQNGESDVRMIKSRSGHIVRLLDKAGEEKIEIIDKSTKNTIVIDSAKNTITITGNDVTIQAPQGRLVLKGKSVEIAAELDLKIQAGTTGELKASGPLTVKGAVVKIN